MSNDLVQIKSIGKTGIMTCIALDSLNKKMYGISAAHVLLGEDRALSLTDVISIRNSSARSGWTKIGRLDTAIYSNGSGLVPVGGFLDVGAFLLRPNFVNLIKGKTKKLRMSSKLKDPRLLESMLVYGNSVQKGRILKGKIKDVSYDLKGKFRFDLRIQFENDSTEGGDSGMLWKDSNGNSIGMHIAGDSTFSYGILINRVAQTFRLPLITIKI